MVTRTHLLPLLIVLPLIVLPLIVLAAPEARGDGASRSVVGFESWRPEVFERAKREQRILVVSIGTTWCHWCHVMKRETYGAPAVRVRLAKRYLPIYVDADARPDLGERFRNYRWPGTAFLTPDGTPILALRGYRNPKAFLQIMDRVERLVAQGGPYPGIDTPASDKAGPSASDQRLDELIRRLRGQMDFYYDRRMGGWGRPQKYPMPEAPLWGLWRGQVHGKDDAGYRQAMHTLRAMAPLLDTAWGGVYQYSLEGRWDRWHPEKIMPINAGALEGWSRAWHLSRDARYRRHADGVVKWLTRFMRADDGSFYASQDADAPRMKGEQFYRLDARARTRYGVPRVDQKRYGRDNAMIIRALVAHGTLADRPASLRMARQAAEAFWRGAHNGKGGLRHTLGDPDPALHLIDHSEMLRAFVALYQATGRSEDLERALSLGETLHTRFRIPGGGYRDLVSPAGPQAPGALGTPIRSLEPHASVAHAFLDLYGLTELPAWLTRARDAIGAVSLPKVTEAHGRYVGGLLHAAERARQPLIRIELVGPEGQHGHEAAARRMARDDPRLFWTRRIAAGRSFSLLCGAGRCSDPIDPVASLSVALEAFLAEVQGKK